VNLLNGSGAASGVDAGIAGRDSRDGLVSVGRRQGVEAAAELVGAVSSQLAFMTLFEQLLAAASFTVLLDACIEHLDFDRVLLRKWVGRSIN
jgi:hypothetical protein